MPIDTSMWSATDTISTNLNDDAMNDLILVFDKYKKATRPDNMQTPVLFFTGKGQGSYSFIAAAERLIFSPYYQFLASGNTFIIQQEGTGDNRIVYMNFYRYSDNAIILYKEIILENIKKLKVDEKTGDVTEKIERTDTIYKRNKIIPVGEYNILDLVNR